MNPYQSPILLDKIHHNNASNNDFLMAFQLDEDK